MIFVSPDANNFHKIQCVKSAAYLRALKDTMIRRWEWSQFENGIATEQWESKEFERFRK